MAFLCFACISKKGLHLHSLILAVKKKSQHLLIITTTTTKGIKKTLN